MSKKCRAYSASRLGLAPADNRKAFYAGWDAALTEPTDTAPQPDDLALLRQALDCLERSETNAHYEGFGRAAERKHEDTIAALRERLGDKA